MKINLSDYFHQTTTFLGGMGMGGIIGAAVFGFDLRFDLAGKWAVLSALYWLGMWVMVVTEDARKSLGKKD